MWGSLDTPPWTFVSTALKLQLPAPSFHQWKGNDSKVHRAGDPPGKCLTQIGPEGLSSIQSESSAALFVKEEQVGSARAIHL